jgi:hypothetical protein
VWDGSSPQIRLAVHQNNVVAGLVNGLATRFPVVQQLVGEEFFRAMAAVFVRQAPPSDPVLTLYGGGFADFISSFQPANGVPYLSDMARLEFARTLSLHAADALPVDGLAAGHVLSSLRHDEKALHQLRLICHPAVQVVRSQFAVVSLWSAHQQGAESLWADLDLDCPEAAVLLRSEWQVLMLPVSLGVAVFVESLLDSRPLSVAANLAYLADASFDLAPALQHLVAHGAIANIY